MEAYYLLYPDGYHCFNQNGYIQAVKSTEESAKAWVVNWNIYNVPKSPVTMEDMMAAEEALKAATDFFAPTTTCTSNAVPCQKGNNPMYIEDCACAPKSMFNHAPKNASGAGAVASLVLNAGPDTEQVQRRHLEQRAYDVRYEKLRDLSKQFFIDEPEGPKTAQEVADRLKAGQYTVKVPKNPVDDDDDEDDFGGFYWRDVFSWRTPETQPDKAGYAAAQKELVKFYDDTIDTISIVSPVEGLAALRALQNWKPSSTGIVAKILG